MALRDLIVNIDFDGLDKDIQQLLKMDTAIDEIEDNLRRMDARVEDVTDATRDMGRQGSSAIDEFNKNTSNTGDLLDDVGNKAGLGASALGMLGTAGAAAGAAIVAGIGLAIHAVGDLVNESEKAFDRLQAQTGASNAAMEGLKKSALDVYASGFGESLPAVTEDLATIKTALRDLHGNELTKFAKGAEMIQELWGSEVRETSQVVKTMQANFKDLSESQALDLITTGFQRGGNYADDLMDTLKEYGPYFSKMGMDAEHFVGTLLAGGKAGAWNLDKVGDAVKEFGIRAIDGSKTTEDAFKGIGLDAKKMAADIAGGGDKAQQAFNATLAALANMDDKVKQGQMGVSLFGTQWEDVRQDVIFAMQDAEGAVSGFEGATDRAANVAYDNFGDKMTQLWRGLKTSAIESFGGSGGALTDFADKALEYLPAIQNMVQGFADGVNGLMDWLESLFQNNSGTIGVYIDQIAGAFESFGGMLSSFWGAFGNDITQFLSNTIILATSIVGGGFQTLSDIFTVFGDLFRGDWDALGTDVLNLVVNLGNNIVNALHQSLNWVFALFGTTFDDIVLKLTGIDLTSVGSDIISGLIDGMKAKFNTAITEVKAFGANIKQSMVDFFDINSPSKVMADEVGRYLPEGVAMGIDQNAQAAIDAAQNMGGEITGAASIAPSGGGSSTTNTFAPNVQITIQAGQGSNEQEIAKAVRAELASLFGDMQLKFS